MGADDQALASKDQRGDHLHDELPGEEHQAALEPAKTGGNAAIGHAGDAAAKRIANQPGKGKPPVVKPPSGTQDLSSPDKVTTFLGTLLQMPETVSRLNAADRANVAAHPPSALDATAKAGLKLVFDHTPDGEVGTLSQLLGARYRIKSVGADQDKGAAWDANGLRRTWSVLEQLPPAHVEGNSSILQLVRYKTDPKTAGEGYYAEGNAGNPDDKIAIAYTAERLDDIDKGDFSDAKDPMYGLNIFNGTVRHEVGHAVDAEGKFSDAYCVGNPSGGNWKSYDADYERCATEMVAASAAGIAKSAHKAELVTELGKIMKQQKFDKVVQLLEAQAFWKKLGADEQKAVLADPVLEALGKNTTANEPWMDGSGGVAINGRIFQESYDQSWTSYALEARDRKVSKYQFRAPGEWFAEAYATYYEPPTKENPKGTLLAKSDPKSKAYFDKNVDSMVGKKGDAAAGAATKKPKAMA